MNILKAIKDKIFPPYSIKELNRLFKLGRYTSGVSELYGYPFHFADALSFIHGGEEIFLKQIYKFNSTNPEPIIIDCGSNIGLSVVYFKTLFPNAIITAFEPDKQLFKILEKNVQNFNNIKLYNKAIWLNDGIIEFQEEGGFSGRIPKSGDINNIVKVPCTRLKDLIINKIDFLKIDIEGAEYEVIKDCADVLSFVENLFIEYHSHISEPQKLDEILNLLSKVGFRYHIQEAFTRKQPYVDKEVMLGMDLQLNIFAYRN